MPAKAPDISHLENLILGLTAEFDVKSGYLLVECEGVLGKQHRGAYDTYTNTLTHHIGRDDVAVFTRNFVRSSRPTTNVAQDMVSSPNSHTVCKISPF